MTSETDQTHALTNPIVFTGKINATGGDKIRQMVFMIKYRMNTDFFIIIESLKLLLEKSPPNQRF